MEFADDVTVWRTVSVEEMQFIIDVQLKNTEKTLPISGVD